MLARAVAGLFVTGHGVHTVVTAGLCTVLSVPAVLTHWTIQTGRQGMCVSAQSYCNAALGSECFWSQLISS